MKENREWNPYYMNAPWSMNPEQRAYPWLYPYGNQMNYWSLWNEPERMEDELDRRRLREMYPRMAKRLQPYVEEVCDRLEYPAEVAGRHTHFPFSSFHNNFTSNIKNFANLHPSKKRPPPKNLPV